MELTPHEIHDSIASLLDDSDGSHDYWAGMSRQDKNDVVIEVQAGRCTIEQAADTIRTWAADYPRED